MNDRYLLQLFSVTADASAFAELVRRHGPMVQAAARRMAGDDADDVAQAVFILLSRKSAHLKGRECIAGWLYQTTRLCARNARRSRHRRESSLATLFRVTPMRMNASQSEEPAWGEVLDDALLQLPAPEREAVLLRYIEGLSVVDAAASLSTSPTAVSKRCTRAINKMRLFFRGRGYPVTDEQMAGTSVLQAIPLSVTQLAGLNGSISQPTGGATTLANATLRMMTLKSAALLTIVGLGVAVAAAAGVAVLFTAQPPPSGSMVSSLAPRGTAATAPAAPAAASADLSPASQSEAQLNSTAAKFLAAVHDGNVDAAAALMDAPSPAAQARAQVLVTAIHQNYRPDLSRITQQQDTYGDWDEYGSLVDGGIDVVAPIDADLEHLTVHLIRKNGQYRVNDASMKTVAVMWNQDEDPAPLDDHRYRDAYTAWLKWTAPARSLHVSNPPDDPDKTAMRQVLISYRDGLPTLLAARQKTDWPTPLEFLPGLTEKLDDLIALLDREGVKAVQARLTAGTEGTLPILLNEGDALKARADAEAQDAAQTPTEPRSLPVGLPMTIPLDAGHKFIIPGPLQVPPWLLSTPSYQLWQTGGRACMLQTTDDAGNRYTVWFDSTPRQGDQPAEQFAHIRQYRKDNTLAAMTNLRDGTARDWQRLDTTGKRYVWKINTWEGMRAPIASTKLRFSRIEQYDSDGSQRAWTFSDDGKFQSNFRMDAIGNVVQGNDQ